MDAAKKVIRTFAVMFLVVFALYVLIQNGRNRLKVWQENRASVPQATLAPAPVVEKPSLETSKRDVVATQKELAQPAKKPKVEPQSITEAPQHYIAPPVLESRIQPRADLGKESTRNEKQQKTQEHVDWLKTQAEEAEVRARELAVAYGYNSDSAKIGRKGAVEKRKIAEEAARELKPEPVTPQKLTAEQKTLKDNAEFMAQRAVEEDVNADNQEAYFGKTATTTRNARESANRYAKAAEKARAKAEEAGVKFENRGPKSITRNSVSQERTPEQKILRDHAETTARQAEEEDVNADNEERYLGKRNGSARTARERANRYAKAAKEARAKAERAGVKFDD